ncbi:hypothetical protein, partial [Dactylosporangium maewongense]|uniref:hypothetical protein n=1 Tax=Dactylosporangium maewongense TaxID=634393 RepID=UPI0031DF2DA6
ERHGYDPTSRRRGGGSGGAGGSGGQRGGSGGRGGDSRGGGGGRQRDGGGLQNSALADALRRAGLDKGLDGLNKK